ncbi:MAG: glutamate--cysteine ligase, partial [Moraxellaceae bacterium]
MVRGIEKESLRVEPNGLLAQTPHPTALGSALTHPTITTDYSEALLEFITPTFTDVDAMLEHLEKTHRYTYQQLDNEKLWVNSMPCIMGDETNIPIAKYGSSNVGKMKHVYRHGLWHRYGRLMQTIAGIHYNVSMPDDFWPGYQKLLNNTDPLQSFISEQYFGLIRNFQRFVGLVIYLYGASPTVCGSFLKGRDHQLENFNDSTLYLPYGTSLRMSDLGYQNDAQSDLSISYNSLEEYVETLTTAIDTPHPAYEDLGTKNTNPEKGTEEYLQLNTNILQIENEYYGSIRPKRVANTGE